MNVVAAIAIIPAGQPPGPLVFAVAAEAADGRLDVVGANATLDAYAEGAATEVEGLVVVPGAGDASGAGFADSSVRSGDAATGSSSAGGCELGEGGSRGAPLDPVCGSTQPERQRATAGAT